MRSIINKPISVCIFCLGILLFLNSCSDWENFERASERSKNRANNESKEPEVILFRVSNTAPGNGESDVPIDTTISITFNKIMDTSTLTTNTSDTQCKSSFKISADDFETCVRMEGSPTPGNSDMTFTITPLVPLDFSTTYKIAINTKVQDTEGNAWKSTYVSSKGFTTSAAPLVSSTVPANAAVDIALDTSISVTFDKSMDTATIITNTDDTICTGSLQVSADGFTTCVRMSASPVSGNSDMTFTVTPLADLEYSARYRVRITTAAKDTAGYALQSEFTASTGFRTLRAWTWVSGSNAVNQPGVYGTKGVAASGNIPGGRTDSVSWIDSSGNLWLFGGYGYDTGTTLGRLNDLWKFDGSNWTWVSGSSTIDQSGTYGTKGIAASGNIPGARNYLVSWIDSSGNLWLFGGYGYDTGTTLGNLNDLWKFDGSNWTWVSGSNAINQPGVYGTKGVAASGNIPGARNGSVSWIDSSGNLWLFGGIGYDTTTSGYLNDLWKFDGSNWTWISGSNAITQTGTYGTKGIVASGNIPGARRHSVSWIDSSGNLWLFGGDGYDTTWWGWLNDLWKFDGSNWTWVSGSNAGNQTGTYGTKGTAATGNSPGGRMESISWIDSSGNLWLFGGVGYDTGTTAGRLNDLWKFDGSNWTWVSGSNSINQTGTYGTKGTAASGNSPGTRDSISWIDSSGNLWLFGGAGYDTTTFGWLNDLWKY